MPTITAECTNFDPRTVIVTISPAGGSPRTLEVRPEEYAILALLPGFPPNPCN